MKSILTILLILFSIAFPEKCIYAKSKIEISNSKKSPSLTPDSLENQKKVLKKEISVELENILNYWIKNTIDQENGGFIGKIDGNDVKYPKADKGLVLNSRILWTFSSAYIHNPKPEYKMMAKRSYEYLMKYFWDKQHGGGYWSVDYLGNPKEKHKQIYGQGFMLYGAFGILPSIWREGSTKYAPSNFSNS